MQARRERLAQWEDPAPTIDFVRRSSGIEAIRAIAAGELPRPPISVLTNFAVTEVEEGRVVVEGYPGEEHYNPIGVVHSGFALTIFDTAMSYAIHTLLPAGVGYTTTDVQVRFIRGVTVATARYAAKESPCTSDGRRRLPRGSCTIQRGSCSASVAPAARSYAEQRSQSERRGRRRTPA